MVFERQLANRLTYANSECSFGILLCIIMPFNCYALVTDPWTNHNERLRVCVCANSSDHRDTSRNQESPLWQIQ